MNPMHPRRHQEQVQAPFQANWQAQVAVVKKRIGLENYFVERESRQRGANQEHLGDAEERREQDLAKMEAKPGRDIELRIDVVDVMKTPEKGNSMIKQVPIIEAQIEQQKGHEELHPRGERQEMQ